MMRFPWRQWDRHTLAHVEVRRSVIQILMHLPGTYKAQEIAVKKENKESCQ